jgi:hypothetical protein
MKERKLDCQSPLVHLLLRTVSSSAMLTRALAKHPLCGLLFLPTSEIVAFGGIV